MADALEALDEIAASVTALAKEATGGRSKYLSPSVAQPITRSIAKIYFASVRQELQMCQSRGGLVEEIDFIIQGLLQFASGSCEKQAYVGHINELRPYLLEATVDLMKSKGAPRLVLSEIERAILETLAALLPTTAASYEQALRDIAQRERVSWRGTANELREALRDVLDHLAPDAKVKAAPGFQFEQNQSQPTQRQKVRFVLRARRSASTVVTVAETSLDRVDEAVATLTRSTYQRSAASTHVGASGKEIRNLKRYVDALLAELLEIG